ncbi:hypothetical protein [Tahibacter caeni]|uniref:hypothetical protein n=1 Tax=Tahibacter caeni TaxID=1453545 RepID=UPI002147B0F3|nr:hypothetical protein [Tahibacter caeni]
MTTPIRLPSVSRRAASPMRGEACALACVEHRAVRGHAVVVPLPPTCPASAGFRGGLSPHRPG